MSERKKLRRKPSGRGSVGLEIVTLQSFEESSCALLMNSPPLHFHFFGILGRFLNHDVEIQRVMLTFGQVWQLFESSFEVQSVLR